MLLLVRPSPPPSLTIVLSLRPGPSPLRGRNPASTNTRLRGPSPGCGLKPSFPIAHPRDLHVILADVRLSCRGRLPPPTASLGIVQRLPLRRHPARSPLPETSAGCPASASFGPGVPTPVHVPSSWFLATSTAFSSAPLRTSCSPLPTLGFTPFPVTLSPPSPGCLYALRSFPS